MVGESGGKASYERKVAMEKGGEGEGKTARKTRTDHITIPSSGWMWPPDAKSLVPPGQMRETTTLRSRCQKRYRPPAGVDAQPPPPLPMGTGKCRPRVW